MGALQQKGLAEASPGCKRNLAAGARELYMWLLAQDNVGRPFDALRCGYTCVKNRTGPGTHDLPRGSFDSKPFVRVTCTRFSLTIAGDKEAGGGGSLR